MHHSFKKLAGTLAAVALAAGLTMAGTGTARADVIPPANTWAEIFAPEINSNGITLCADNLWLERAVPEPATVALPRLRLQRHPAALAVHLQGNFLGSGVPEYRISNVGSGLCIGLDPNRVNANTVAGSNLLQESCSNSSSRQCGSWCRPPTRRTLITSSCS